LKQLQFFQAKRILKVFESLAIISLTEKFCLSSTNINMSNLLQIQPTNVPRNFSGVMTEKETWFILEEEGKTGIGGAILRGLSMMIDRIMKKNYNGPVLIFI
jgi:hypothetical protein